MALKGMMKGWIVGFKVDNNGTYVRFDGDLKNYDGDENLVEILVLKNGQVNHSESNFFISYNKSTYFKVSSINKISLQMIENSHCKICFEIYSPYIKFNQSNSQLDFTLNGFDFAKALTVISIENKG